MQLKARAPSLGGRWGEGQPSSLRATLNPSRPYLSLRPLVLDRTPADVEELGHDVGLLVLRETHALVDGDMQEAGHRSPTSLPPAS